MSKELKDELQRMKRILKNPIRREILHSWAGTKQDSHIFVMNFDPTLYCAISKLSFLSLRRYYSDIEDEVTHILSEKEISREVAPVLVEKARKKYSAGDSLIVDDMLFEVPEDFRVSVSRDGRKVFIDDFCVFEDARWCEQESNIRESEDLAQFLTEDQILALGEIVKNYEQ